MKIKKEKAKQSCLPFKKYNLSQRGDYQNNLYMESGLLYKILVLEKRQEGNDNFFPSTKIFSPLSSLLSLDKAMRYVFEAGKKN